jgi:hypothetical protein
VREVEVEVETKTKDKSKKTKVEEKLISHLSLLTSHFSFLWLPLTDYRLPITSGMGAGAKSVKRSL